MRKYIRFVLAAVAFLMMAPMARAGVIVLPADGVEVNNPKWWNIPHVFADDDLYAIDTMLSNWGQHKFRVSLADPDPSVTQNTIITSVVLYVKARTHYNKSSESLCPFFGGQTGITSAPMKLGTVEITNAYNITAQETLLTDDHWDWDDIASLSVEYAPRKLGVVYYVNYIYAVVTYRDTLQTPEGHWFEFAPISSPETLAVQFPVTISARDLGGNLLTTYNQSAQLSDLTGTVSPNVVSFSGGVANTSVTIYDVSAANVLTVSDGDTFGMSNAFAVINPGLHHFEFAAIPTPQTQNTPFGISIAACDFFGDTVTSFVGPADLWDLTGTLTPGTTSSFNAGIWSGPVTVASAIGVDTIFCGYNSSRGYFTGASNGFEVQEQMGTTGESASATSAVKYFNTRIKPNPLRGWAHLEMYLPEAGRVRATLFNILGQEVISCDLGTVAAGIRRYTWKFEKVLNSNIYFLVISYNGNNLVHKISVVR